MKKLTLLLISFICFATYSISQDFYTAQERSQWLQKAQENIPVLSETLKQPKGVVNIVKDEAAYQGWKVVPASPVQTFYKESLKEQSGAIIDFGEHITGYFTFTVSPLKPTPDAPARIKFTFGESPAELMTSFDNQDTGLSRAWLQDEIVTVMTVPDTITISRRLAFRYVKIELLHAPSYEFTVSDMSCKAVTSATSEPEPLPASTPQIIKDIDRIALNTLKACMQTVYEDGPKRDQRLWIGDLYLEALANNYSYRNHGLTKRCLYLLAGLAEKSGFLNATVFERPYPHPQAKQLALDYSLIYNVALKDYLEATNDYETANDLWKAAKRQIDMIDTCLQDNGLMNIKNAGKDWWIFIDWRDELDKEVSLQGVSIFVLKQTYELAKMLGKEKELADVPKKIKKMTDAARKHFYDKKTGLFAGLENKQISYHSQFWMTISGVASKTEAQRALKALHNVENVVRPGAPYGYHYYIQALITCGMHTEAKDALIQYWGGMVNKGADTFWEVYDPNNDYLSPYGFYPMNSYAHAWSCTPVYFIRKYFK